MRGNPLDAVCGMRDLAVVRKRRYHRGMMAVTIGGCRGWVGGGDVRGVRDAAAVLPLSFQWTMTTVAAG